MFLNVVQNVIDQVPARHCAAQHVMQITGLPAIPVVIDFHQHRKLGIARDLENLIVRVVFHIAIPVFQGQPFRHQMRQVVQVQAQRNFAGLIPVDVKSKHDGLIGAWFGSGPGHQHGVAIVSYVFHRPVQLIWHRLGGLLSARDHGHFAEIGQAFHRG